MNNKLKCFLQARWKWYNLSCKLNRAGARKWHFYTIQQIKVQTYLKSYLKENGLNYIGSSTPRISSYHQPDLTSWYEYENTESHGAIPQ